MDNCGNLCTAAKCKELEIRIDALESVVQFLMAELDAHKSLDIPQAHDYQSNLKISGNFQSETLTLTVADETSQDTATISIPDNDVDVALAVDSGANTIKVFVKVGSKNDSDTVNLPKNEPDVDVALAVDSDANTLKAFVKVGDKSDEETVELPEKVDPLDWLDLLKSLLGAWLLSELKDDLKDLIRDAIDSLIENVINNLFKNLSISSDYNGNNLQICVSNGSFSDCTSVYIPRGGGDNGNEETNDFLNGSGYLDEAGILNLVINSSIGNADIQVDMGLAEIERLLTEVHEYTVVDIEGNTATKFLCADPEKPANPDNTRTLLEYSGKGLIGLHELTKTFNDNLLTVFTEICQKDDAVAAIPEWWQVRAGSDRPQLVVIYRAGPSNWSMSIPWYRGAYKSATIKQIPGYTRGAYASYLTLGDNSKIVVNAVSKQAGEVFLSRIRSVIKGEMLTDATIQTGGERKGKAIDNVAVKPAYAKYFANGQKDQLPDWGYNFLTDKWVKYVKATE